MDTTHCITDAQWLRFADGSLSREERQAMLDHIGQCELCADIADGILAMPDAKALHSRVDAINTRVDALTQNKTKKLPVFWYWSAAAVLLLAAGLAWMVLNQPLENKVAQKPEVTETKHDTVITQTTPVEVKKDEKTVVAKHTEMPKWNRTDEVAERSVTENLKVPVNQEESGLDDMTVTEDTKGVTTANGSGAVHADTVYAIQPAPSVAEDKKTVTPAGENSYSVKETEAASNKQTRRAESMAKNRKKKAESNPAPANVNNRNNADAYDEEAAAKDYKKPLDYRATDSILLHASRTYYDEKNYAQSLQSISEILKRPNSVYYEDALFQQARSLIALNRKDAARSVLTKVVGLNGKWKAEAEALLKTL